MSEKSGAIPETIKIGEQEYKISEHPELVTLLEAARKQEKDKVYKDISGYKDQVKTLKEELDKTKSNSETAKITKELEEAQNALKDAQAQKDVLNNKPATNPEEDKLKKEKMEEELLKKLEDSFEKKLEEKLKTVSGTYEEKISKLENQLKGSEAASYRDKLLAQYKDQVIPNLVKGNTKEELDAALQEALEVSKDYVSVDYKGKRVTLAEKAKLEEEDRIKAEEKKKAEELAAEQRRYANPPNRQTPPNEDTLMKDVKNLPDQSYAENRAAILAKAKQAAQAANTNAE